MAATGVRWAMKLAYLEMLRRVPDKTAVSLDYLRVFGALPNLRNPQRFSEKIQLLKLTEHDARMPDLVDKVRVKAFVTEKLGADWVIPTYWHGPRASEAILRDLPTPSVMKANHSSAQVVFLKPDTDLAAAAETANGWLSYDHHVIHREWAYGEVKREILVEAFIGDDNGVAPNDYKFWVIDGEVSFIQIDFGRFSRHTRQFYTPDWRQLNLRMNYPTVQEQAPRPDNLERMMEAAQTLARDFRFVRVDLYDTPRGPLFGEMTFAPEAGLCRFQPADFDLKLGESWGYPQPTINPSRLHQLAEAFRFTP